MVFLGILILILIAKALFWKPITLSPSYLNLTPSLYKCLESKVASFIQKSLALLQLSILIIFVIIISIQKTSLEIPNQWQDSTKLVIILDSSLFYQLDSNQSTQLKQELLIPFIKNILAQTTCIYGISSTTQTISPCTRNTNYLINQINQYPVYPNYIFNSIPSLGHFISDSSFKNSHKIIFYQEVPSIQPPVSENLLNDPSIVFANISFNKKELSLKPPLQPNNKARVLTLNLSNPQQFKASFTYLKLPKKVSLFYSYWPKQSFFIGLLLVMILLECCICTLAKAYRYV